MKYTFSMSENIDNIKDVDTNMRIHDKVYKYYFKNIFLWPKHAKGSFFLENYLSKSKDMKQ